jgi:hypothetical protein
MSDFNFDEWAELYENDPLEFERRRTAILNAEILKAPEEHRAMLRVLQMECDAIRAVNSPLEATIKISKMMTDRLTILKGQLTALREVCEDINDPE